MMVLASTISRAAIEIVDVGERDLLDRHRLPPRRWPRPASTSLEVERGEQVRVLVAEPGRVEELASGTSRPGRRPISSTSSRRRSRSGGSPSTSRLPAGTSSRSLPVAARNWRTSMTVVAVGVDRHDDDRTGMVHDDRG